MLMLILGLLFARKLVLWPYSSCVMCRDVWRRKPMMDSDDRVVDANWIYLARLMMRHCLSPTPSYFVSSNTIALDSSLTTYGVCRATPIGWGSVPN